MNHSFQGRSFVEGPFLFVLIAFILFNSVACSRIEREKMSAKEYDQQTLFKVNNIDVSVFEFNEAYVGHLIRSGQNDTKEERYRFMNRWIDNILLANQALSKGLNSTTEYQEAVSAQKRKSVADIMFIETMNDSLPELTDEEMRLAFAKSKRKVYVRQLYATNEEALVPWYDSLLAGADFIEIANQFYETPEFDSLAGYLGPIGYYSVDDRFAETAFSLNEGEISKPFRSKLGWHIIWVEHLIMEAMLAEDEYQIRKKRTATQIGTRKANLFATEFITRRMQGLDVKPSRNGILKLREVLQSYALSDEEIQQEEYDNHPEFWQQKELNAFSDELDPNMVLATYNYNGQDLSFTVEDYLKWLPFLPANESSARTGASVGRAMRNEYFYQEGLDAGMDEQFEVKRMVRNRGLDVLSQLYQRSIISEAIQKTDSVQTPSWFVQQMYPPERYAMQIQGWYVPVKNVEEGRKIKQTLIGNAETIPQNAILFDPTESIERQHPFFTLVSKAILNEPMLANNREKGWVLLQITQRSFLPVRSFEEAKVDSSIIQQQFAAYKALNDSLDQYRIAYRIELDTLLFDEIYQLDRAKEED